MQLRHLQYELPKTDIPRLAEDLLQPLNAHARLEDRKHNLEVAVRGGGDDSFVYSIPVAEVLSMHQLRIHMRILANFFDDEPQKVTG